MKLLVLFFPTLTLLAQAPQATVRIEVKTESGPVPSAVVKLNSQTLQTGADGIASAIVPLGPLKVEVSKDGFLPSTTALEIDEAKEWIVQMELRPEETVEEEITVYATRNDVRIQDSPLRVEVLNREEIEEKMLMTPGDIVMMLNEMGGMRVQTTSPSLGAASVRMQGMRGPLYAVPFGWAAAVWATRRRTRAASDSPMDLGQVEVIKGISSALYGAGAMAGVVNLISRRPASEPVREFLINRTTLGGTDASAFVGSRLSSRWGMTFLGGGHWQEQLDRDDDGWADLAGYSRAVARPRFYWDGGNGRTALLTGGITYEDRSGGTVPGAVLPATGEPYREGLDTRRYDFGGNTQWLLADRYVVSARFSASTQHHDHRFGEIRERDRHELLFGEVSLRGSHGRHTWVAGVAAERDAYRPLDVPRFAYPMSHPGCSCKTTSTSRHGCPCLRARVPISTVSSEHFSALVCPHCFVGQAGPAASPPGRGSLLHRR